MGDTALDIDILVDTPTSWFNDWAPVLQAELEARGHRVRHIHDRDALAEGDVAFLLSCVKLVPQSHLDRHRHNLVCHPSDLPAGKGHSPLAWQMLEGRDEIVFTLFEAVAAMDAGPWYDKRALRLGGWELNDDVKGAQGRLNVEMCVDFIDALPEVSGTVQQGEESIYAKRTAASSRLDPQASIASQFDLLRIVDNDRYPAFFDHRGHRYTLRIDLADDHLGGLDA